MSETRELNEAWEALRFHFTDPEGLIARFEAGYPIESEPLEQVRQAIERIELSWEGQSDLPKEDVYRLWTWHPMHRLEACIKQHPERREDPAFSELIELVGHGIGQMFKTDTANEEYALSILYNHLVGNIPSFLIELRSCGEIDKDAVWQVLFCLDMIAPFWKQRSVVPRWCAGGMVDVRQLVRRVSGIFTEQTLSELRVIQEQFEEKVQKCLE